MARSNDFLNHLEIFLSIFLMSIQKIYFRTSPRYLVGILLARESVCRIQKFLGGWINSIFLIFATDICIKIKQQQQMPQI